MKQAHLDDTSNERWPRVRILFTSDFLDPDDIGGSGRVILEAGSRLVRCGHEVTILAGGKTAEYCTRTRLGVPFEWASFAYPRGDDRSVRTWIQMRREARLAFRNLPTRPDLIIHNQPLTADVLSTGRTPVIYLFHSPWPLEYLAEAHADADLSSIGQHRPRTRIAVAARRFLELKAVRGARQLVTLSETMKRHAQEIHGIPQERITVLPGSADFDRFTPVGPSRRQEIRARLGVSEDSTLLVSVRRLIPRTGIDLAVEAFRQALAVTPKLQLFIAGQGSLREELEALVRPLGLGDRIRFLGYVPDDELPDLYRAADAALMPTRALEGFGLSTLEALASGTPVLATPVGGSVEILSGLDPRLLAQQTSVAGLEALFVRWAQNPDQLASLRDRCRQHAEDGYSWDAMAQGIEAIAKSLIPPGISNAPSSQPVTPTASA